MGAAQTAEGMKASVCMAVYNGSEFLRPQIESILAQLRPFDELVVVDDASQDGSYSILEGIKDVRLRLHRNDSNAGVLRTFERALKLASGDILFLSDQDDIWLADKLALAMQVFGSRPQVTMVASDVRLIDEEGRTINESFYATRGRFRGGPVHNLIKNKHLGCTLSFRRTMLEIFLPIPPDVPMHDIWFGVLNSLYGRTHFIDRPLVAYRRHGTNASPLARAGAGQIVVWRYRLAKNLVLRILARTFASR
jgi:glycosyltransferase involved in cell wall biosynthesis